MYHTEPPTDKTIREWYMNSSRVAAYALRNEQAVRAHRLAKSWEQGMCTNIGHLPSFQPTAVKCDASKISHHQFSLDSRHHNSSIRGPDLPSIV